VQLVAMVIWLGPSMRLSLFHARRHAAAARARRAGARLVIAVRQRAALLPLADATAINYSTPVLVVLLAVVLPGERMTRARIAFVVAGLAGMLLIVQPGSDVFQGGSLFAHGGGRAAMRSTRS
jgi:drug/metabolite transporter (DMT)-like permease